MTDKTQPTGAGVPAAQLDAILLAMHLRQRAKLTATGNADALSQNAANVLVAQYDRIAELKAEGSRLQNGLEAQRMLTDRAISVAKDLDAQAAAKCLHQGADAGAVAALKGLLSLVRREAPQLSGKVLGDAESAIATLQAAPPAPAAVAVSDEGAMFEAWVRTHEDAHGAFDDWSARAGWEARAALAAAPAQAGAVPIELRGIKETAEQGGGFWRSCTGCHELNEGHSTGPFSAVFGCALGNGCSECGGIGAVWDDLDYGAMADAMAAPAQEHATQLAGQCGEQDDGLAQAIDERDTVEGWADGLAALIGAYFGQDIGEHSSAHNPWQEAKDIIEEAEPYRSAAAPAQAQEDAPVVRAGLLAAAAHIRAKASAHAEECGSYDPDTGAFEMRDAVQDHYNTLDELAEEIRLMADKAAPASCDKPPAGWACSRAPGHVGPCAAACAAQGEA